MSTATAPAFRLVQPSSVPDQATALRLAGEALVRLGAVFVTMGSQPPQLPPQPAEDWISAEAAARCAGMPLGSPAERRRARARIYSWASGKTWASRPNARTLLVDELRFRRWLRARRDKPERVS